MPKVELHRHLDGSVRIETIWDLARQHGLDVSASSIEELRSRATILSPLKDLKTVLECFSTLQKVLRSFEALSRVTFENIEDAFRDGVKLVELRFAPPFIARGKTLSNDEIIGGVLDGLSRGMARYPVQVGLIGILPRSSPLEENARATHDLIRWKKGGAPNADRICGFDLADRESDFDPETLVPLVNDARGAGMGITVHSGEDTDAARVEKTLDLYRPRRIGHGIRSWGSARTMARLRGENVLLEICPTSNWLTSAVPSLEEHPLPRLRGAGVPVCINSDDPHLMAIDLVHEYEICRKIYGFTDEDFLAMNKAALAASFLPEEIKAQVERTHFSG